MVCCTVLLISVARVAISCSDTEHFVRHFPNNGARTMFIVFTGCALFFFLVKISQFAIKIPVLLFGIQLERTSQLSSGSDTDTATAPAFISATACGLAAFPAFPAKESDPRCERIRILPMGRVLAELSTGNYYAS